MNAFGKQIRLFSALPVFSLLLKLGSLAKVFLLLLVSPRQPREKTSALTVH